MFVLLGQEFGSRSLTDIRLLGLGPNPGSTPVDGVWVATEAETISLILFVPGRVACAS